MKFFRHSPESELEARLRADRPQPGSELVEAIVARTDRSAAPARPRSLRVAFAVVTVGALTALGTLGGVGYAASSVGHAAKAVKSVFVSNAPKGESKENGPFAGAIPSAVDRTAAGDQYGGPPGPFLPVGVTAPQAALNFANYLLGANAALAATLRCNARTAAAKTACLATLQRMQAQYALLQQRLAAASARIGALSSDRQALVARLLAIHLQQEERLTAGQATRRTNCAGAAYAAAHRVICSRTNPAAEAAERLRLGVLELQELEGLLAT